MYTVRIMSFTSRIGQDVLDKHDCKLANANAVLRGLGRKSFRDATRIARESKTIQDVEETIQTLKKYDLK